MGLIAAPKDCARSGADLSPGLQYPQAGHESGLGSVGVRNGGGSAGFPAGLQRGQSQDRWDSTPHQLGKPRGRRKVGVASWGQGLLGALPVAGKS